jgi:hypothetical protein
LSESQVCLAIRLYRAADRGHHSIPTYRITVV